MNPENRRRARVFVLEDEALILMLLADLIAQAGHDCVFRASRLEDAAGIAATGDFDLAILDVTVRGETSFAIADAVAARGLPVIFATGYGERGLPQSWAKAPVLQKPFDARALVETIRRVSAP